MADRPWQVRDPAVAPQVRPAHTGKDDAHDGIGRLDHRGLGSFLDCDAAFPLKIAAFMFHSSLRVVVRAPEPRRSDGYDVSGYTSVAVKRILSIRLCYGAGMPEALPGRALRKDAAPNRERLLAAAGELFAEHGLAVTLNDIAHHAGVGVGTAYRRFANKEEVIDALFEQRLRTWRRWRMTPCRTRMRGTAW